MWKLANPAVFLGFARHAIPWLAALTAVAFAIGLWGAGTAPDDYQQGATVKIMYVHVPAAALGMAGWTLMSLSAVGTLVWRHPLAEVAMKASAPIGAAFTLVCLVTGSLWGQPMWGTWWEWDARLTSVLVLFLMYLGLLALWRAIEDPGRAARVVAVLVLVGAVNIPIIHGSVIWWNTLHQGPTLFKLGRPDMPWSMLWPLLAMLLAFTLLYASLQVAAMRNEILRRRIRTMQLMAAAAPASLPAGAVGARG